MAPFETFCRRIVVLVSPVTASLKVAVMLAVRAKPVPLNAGVRAMTEGGVFTVAAPVVKLQVNAASGLPATSVMPGLVSRTV